MTILLAVSKPMLSEKSLRKSHLYLRVLPSGSQVWLFPKKPEFVTPVLYSDDKNRVSSITGLSILNSSREMFDTFIFGNGFG